MVAYCGRQTPASQLVAASSATQRAAGNWSLSHPE